MGVPLEAQLKKSGQVTLDSAGLGTLYFSPDHANQSWEIDAVVVATNQASTATVIPVATLALNTISKATMSAGNQQGATWNGNQMTFRGTLLVGECDFLTVLFTPPTGSSGASLAGVIASVVITGKKITRR